MLTFIRFILLLLLANLIKFLVGNPERIANSKSDFVCVWVCVDVCVLQRITKPLLRGKDCQLFMGFVILF